MRITKFACTVFAIPFVFGLAAGFLEPKTVDPRIQLRRAAESFRSGQMSFAEYQQALRRYELSQRP